MNGRFNHLLLKKYLSSFALKSDIDGNRGGVWENSRETLLCIIYEPTSPPSTEDKS